MSEFDLRGVAEGMTYLRNQVKEVMKECAAVDSDSCKLETIGQTLIDLFEDNKRLHHRRQIAEDGLDHALTEANVKLRAEISLEKTRHSNSVENYEAELVSSRKKIADLENELATKGEQIEHISAEKKSIKGMAVDVMQNILMRPDGFLDVYGEGLYMQARASYGRLNDGDFSRLPMPTPERKEPLV